MNTTIPVAALALVAAVRAQTYWHVPAGTNLTQACAAAAPGDAMPLAPGAYPRFSLLAASASRSAKSVLPTRGPLPWPTTSERPVRGSSAAGGPRQHVGDLSGHRRRGAAAAAR